MGDSMNVIVAIALLAIVVMFAGMAAYLYAIIAGIDK